MVVVTRKYQITIPKEVREALKIKIGDHIEIVRNKKGEFVIKKIDRNKEKYIKALNDAVGILRITQEDVERIKKAVGESMHA